MSRRAVLRNFGVAQCANAVTICCNNVCVSVDPHAAKHTHVRTSSVEMTFGSLRSVLLNSIGFAVDHL